MQLTFTSSPADHNYFKEVSMNVESGVQFDFYENGNHAGTLIDFNFQAIGIWNGTVEYISRAEPFTRELAFNFKLTNKESVPFAWGEVDNDYTVMFPAHHSSYKMIPRTHRFSKEKFRNSYEFVMHKKNCCLIKYGAIPQNEGWFRKHFYPGDSTGVIEMKDTLTSGHLFGFMLMVSRYWIWPGPENYHQKRWSDIPE